MAESFLSLNRRERADILQTVAANSEGSAVIREKDIQVCWVVRALFSVPNPHPMCCGIHCLAPSYANRMLGIGFDLVTLGSDIQLYSTACASAIAGART